MDKNNIIEGFLLFGFACMLFTIVLTPDTPKDSIPELYLLMLKALWILFIAISLSKRHFFSLNTSVSILFIHSLIFINKPDLINPVLHYTWPVSKIISTILLMFSDDIEIVFQNYLLNKRVKTSDTK